MAPPQTPTPARAATPTAITINNAQTLMKQVAGVKGAAGDMGNMAGLVKCNIPIQLSISSAASLTSSQGLTF